jgi:hypothetical protein
MTPGPYSIGHDFLRKSDLAMPTYLRMWVCASDVDCDVR